MKFVECSQEGLEDQAYLLSRRLQAPATVFLWGAMGAGKSTFARAFLRSYFQEETLEVPSPTFTLVQTYEPKDPARSTVWHVDLYRIQTLDEVWELGLDEALSQHICLIEWPDRLENLFIPNRINVYIDIISEDRRAFAICSN